MSNKQSALDYFNDCDEITDLYRKLEYYDKALQIDPNFFEAFVNKGVVLSKIGEKRRAIECYDQALAIKPRYAQVFLNKANELYSLGEIQEAIECYNQAIAINPRYAEAFFNKGVALSSLGKKREAIKCYSQAIAINPNYDQALFNKGVALSSLGKKREAIKCYNQFIAIKPRYAQVFLNKGNALYDLGEKREAIKCYSQAIAINPRYSDAFNSKGNTLYNLGDKREAIECYNQAIAINPNDDQAFNNKGFVLSEIGEKQEAIECYDKAIKIDPDCAKFYNNKAAGLIELQRFDEAQECCKKCLQLNPGDGCAYAAYGYTLYKQHHLVEAIEYYDKQITVSPDNWSTFAKKGQALIELQKPREALALFEKALQTLNEGQLVGSSFKLREFDATFSPYEMNLVPFLHQLGPLSAIEDPEILGKELKAKMSQTLEESSYELSLNPKTLQDQYETSGINQNKKKTSTKIEQFIKKLDDELKKQGLSESDQTKIKAYFKAFINTFTSLYSTSQMIDSSKPIQIESQDETVSFLSTLSSFAIHLDDALSKGTSTVRELYEHKTIKANARMIIQLAPDSNQLNEILGSVCYEIVLDKNKQAQILAISEAEANESQKIVFKKIEQLCEKLEGDIDCNLYTLVYNGPSEKMGHRDANYLIAEWINRDIDPSCCVKKQFVELVIKEALEKTL